MQALTTKQIYTLDKDFGTALESLTAQVEEIAVSYEGDFRGELSFIFNHAGEIIIQARPEAASIAEEVRPVLRAVNSRQGETKKSNKKGKASKLVSLDDRYRKLKTAYGDKSFTIKEAQKTLRVQDNYVAQVMSNLTHKGYLDKQGRGQYKVKPVE